MRENAKTLLDFIYKSPTAYQATQVSKQELLEAGFVELFEKDEWTLEAGKKYFVTKNNSAFAAFVVGTDDKNPAVRGIAAHTDSPAFVIKPNPDMKTQGHLTLNTSPYGGMILHTWFDRPLALAGRVLLKGPDFLNPVEKFININKPLVVIPSLAIHLNREVNQGYKINPQKDTLPFVGMVNDQLEKDGYLLGLITTELGCDVADILDFDLTLYEYAKGELIGTDEAYISSPRLDDLWMVWAGLQAIKAATPAPFTQLLYCPDNEEIGSLTAHGGESRFFLSIINRITKDKVETALANTYLISADLGHATNPNHTEKDDVTTKSVMGGGILLKYSAMQKYATNGYTAAVFKALCQGAGVPCQGYITRSDVQGGSTVGAMMAANFGIKVVDMGLAVLGMHSIRELGAVADNEYVLKLFKTFFSTEV